MKAQVDSALRALLLIKIGQELGADSPLARAVYDAISALISLAT